MEIIKIHNFLTIIYLIAKIVSSESKTWTFELKSITSHSSNPEKMEIDFDIQRVSRGVFAVTGELRLYIDVFEDDNIFVASKTYRSMQADGDFKVVPMNMSPTPLFKVFSTYYKNVLMNTLKDCSNFPVFEDEFEPPLRKDVYRMEACQFTEDGFPSHLQEGFYKLVLIGSGEADWEVAIVVEIIHDD